MTERDQPRPSGNRSGGRPRPGDTAPPESVEQALSQAGRHARAALAETLAALHALMDAASLLASGEAANANRVLGPLARLVDSLGSELDGDREAAALLGALAEALDSEITRWEARASDDEEARAVLRAFLGLRELLWEFGVRREPDPGGRGRRRPRKAGRSEPTRKGRRVRRVPVEG